MTHLLIHDTVGALDRALARIAIGIAGTRHGAQNLLQAVSQGEHSAVTSAFLTEAAALLRARRLLADAMRQDALVSRQLAA